MNKGKLSKENYQFFSQFLYKSTGLELGNDKEYLLESRLQELWAALGLTSLDEFAVHLQTKKDLNLEKKVSDLMTTNESLFFRDTTPFVLFQKTFLPEVYKLNLAKKSLNIWSAACSTGQEPYSIAICLLESGLNWSDWNIKILATDFASHILKRAQTGKYSAYELGRGMPPDLRDKYFDAHGAEFVVKPIIQKWIRFEEQNLLSIAPNIGPFDFIFLRNVLIYFDVETKTKVLSEFRKLIDPKGTLFLGSTESILGITTSFARIEGEFSSIYKPV